MFLLKAEEQHRLIQRFADILLPGGRLLFTSTAEPHVWTDVMTGLESISLGAEEYWKLLGAAGVLVAEEYEDAGETTILMLSKTSANHSRESAVSAIRRSLVRYAHVKDVRLYVDRV